MRNSPTAPSSYLTKHFLPLAAAVAMIAGVLVYLLSRPSQPEFIHFVLAVFGRNAQFETLIPLPLTYQLPSFFHMLALMLAAGAFTQQQPRLRAVALTVTFVFGLSMEFVQHPAVSSTLSSCSGKPCSWIHELEAYADSGTFDILDLVAIALAALLALVIIALTPSARNRD